MSIATETLDQVMEQASQALAEMSYLRCERLCEQAMTMAVDAGRWTYASRILLPLQESRRQRRMIAADGVIRLGTADVDRASLSQWVWSWIEQHQAGCLAVDVSDGLNLETIRKQIRDAGFYVELLGIEARGQDRWTICVGHGPDSIRCEVGAPQASMMDQDVADCDEHMQAAGWFLEALELLGDAAYASMKTRVDALQRVAALQRAVTMVGDHELLHQHLGAAMREIALR